MSARRVSHATSDDVNLWKIPLQLSLAAALLFCVTCEIDRLDQAHVITLPMWLHFGGIDDCRALLGALMGAVSTVLALIFSVALLVLSMVATLFGPRLLYRFIQDPVTQTTIGLFMASFVYIQLTFLVEQQEGNVVFVPQLTVMCCWLLVLISFSSLVYYSHRVATSIQNPDMIARIVDDFHAAVHDLAAVPRGQGVCELPAGPGARYLSKHSGYLQHVDHRRLLAAASQHGATFSLLFRPGQFVLAGEALAEVWPSSLLGALETTLHRSLHVGRHRVLRQDIEFGIFQIVEIGIRALSPAVNDTFTGVACVDWIGDALLVMLTAPRNDGCWYDAAGRLAIRQPELHFHRLARLGFDQLRQAASDNPAVLVRILTTIRRLSPVTGMPSERAVLLEEVTAIGDTVAGGAMAALDRRDVEAATESARLALISRNPAPSLQITADAASG